MQSLQAEVEPFGINTITVNPGFFRTELLTEESTNFAERTIEDYNERRAKQMEFWVVPQFEFIRTCKASAVPRLLPILAPTRQTKLLNHASA